MEYFWKENKRFVLMVGGGFVFLLLYNSFVLSPLRSGAADAARKRMDKRRELERKMAQGVPTDDTLVAARRDRDQNQKLLASVGPEIAFAVSDRFQKPKRDSAKAYFEDLKLDLIKELQQKAVAAKISMPPDLGLGGSVSDEEAPELLLRLAVIDRLVNVAIESQIEKIEAIDGLFGVDLNAGPGKKSQFLSKYSVFMRFSGKAESIFRVLHGVQKKGSYLAVTHFELSRPDSTKEIFEATIAVALLRVDDKAGLDAR